jgi:molecular chaperone GrpE
MQMELAETIKVEQESLLTVVETAEANSKDAKAKLEQLKDQYRRLQADFDNFRSRAEAERAQTGQNVKMSVVEDLLPLVDNFELASVQVRVYWFSDSVWSVDGRSLRLQHIDAGGTRDSQLVLVCCV